MNIFDSLKQIVKQNIGGVAEKASEAAKHAADEAIDIVGKKVVTMTGAPNTIIKEVEETAREKVHEMIDTAKDNFENS